MHGYSYDAYSYDYDDAYDVSYDVPFHDASFSLHDCFFSYYFSQILTFYAHHLYPFMIS